MGSLQPYFDLYQFPTGRRLFAMRGVAERARARQLAGIAELAEAAVEQGKKTAELESAWRRARSTKEGQRKLAAAIDNELDRVLGGMATHLGGMVHAFGAQGVGTQAEALLSQLFPEGPAAITNLSFENELAAAEVVLADLRGPHAQVVAALGLAPFVARLEEVAERFHDALKQEAVREVSYDTLRQAQAEGQEAMLRVVAKILGDFHGPEPAQADLRRELLAPVMSQNRRMRERYASRRGPADVSPETGEEIPESGEEIPENGEEIPGSGASTEAE